MVIGRKEGNRGFGVHPQDPGDAQGRGRTAVLGAGLNDEIFLGQVGELQLENLGHLGVRDHMHALDRDDRRQALNRDLEHGPVAEQGQGLLGHQLSAERPQPGATPAGHDEGMKHGVS